MENASLPIDVVNNVTTSSSEDDVSNLHLANVSYVALKIVFRIRNDLHCVGCGVKLLLTHSLKIVYIIIGIVGVLDNLFVLVVFALFIKITDKVKTDYSFSVL